MFNRNRIKTSVLERKHSAVGKYCGKLEIDRDKTPRKFKSQYRQQCGIYF